MTMLESLTPAQEAMMGKYRDKWIKIGLSTEPADRTAAEDAIARMYLGAGLSVPKVVWCGSPLSQAIARAITLELSAFGLASVSAHVRDSVWDSVGAHVGASVWECVWDSFMDSVMDGVWAHVGASVWDCVRDSVRDSVCDIVWDSISGSHDAGWLSFCDFFRACGLVEQTDPIVPAMDLVRSAGWALPYEGICWVSERPCELHRDTSGRLHSLSGPALRYPDGFAIYAVHGVRVPSYVVERPGEITVERIDGEANAEVRRVMIERFGVGRYVSESGAEVVDQASLDHPIIGVRGARLLFKPTDLYERPLYFVECINSSPEPDGSYRKYHLAVNPGHYDGMAGVSVIAALASTWRDPFDRSKLIFPRPKDYAFASGES